MDDHNPRTSFVVDFLTTLAFKLLFVLFCAFGSPTRPLPPPPSPPPPFGAAPLGLSTQLAVREAFAAAVAVSFCYGVAAVFITVFDVALLFLLYYCCCCGSFQVANR